MSLADNIPNITKSKVLLDKQSLNKINLLPISSVQASTVS